MEDQAKYETAQSKKSPRDHEFTIEQLRSFVSKGYTSVAARMLASALRHYDELKSFRGELPFLSQKQAISFAMFFHGYVMDEERPWGDRRSIWEVWIEAGRPEGYVKPPEGYIYQYRDRFAGQSNNSCVDKGRKKDGPCKYPIGTCEWCANIY